MGWVILIVVGIGALLGVVFYLGYLYEKNRSTSLGEIAAGLGFDFAPKTPPTWLTGATLPLFSIGRARKYHNVMMGEGDDELIYIFDYQYTVGSGKHTQTFKQTVVGIDSKLLNLPRFDMQPETFFHRVGAWFGSKDIDFPDNPDFSRRYFLRSDNETRVREAFTPPVIAALEKKKNLRLEGDGTTMIFYRSGKRTPPADVKELLREAFEVYALFKQSKS